jgi:hypothetical protein
MRYYCVRAGAAGGLGGDHAGTTRQGMDAARKKGGSGSREDFGCATVWRGGEHGKLALPSRLGTYNKRFLPLRQIIRNS